MDISPDLLEAKQAVSGRLLRKRLRGGVVSRGRHRSIRAAIESAGANVHAVGVGPKVVSGRRTNQLAVRLYVVHKFAESIIPPRDRLPRDIDGVPTDVIESSQAFLSSALGSARSNLGVKDTDSCTDLRTKGQRPVIAGVSTAHYDLTAGTIGYFCRSTRHGDDPQQVFVMSSSHVFAPLFTSQRDDDLYQPAPDDGGSGSDHFAELHRRKDIHIGENVPNRVDAAIGALLPNVEYELQVCSIGKIEGTRQATMDMTVRKHGRTTGYTEGIIVSEPYDAVVGVDHNDPNLVALFQNQMRIESLAPYSIFASDGDSGSLIVSGTTPEAVGLLCATPPSGEYAVANHIDDILTELQVELL